MSETVRMSETSGTRVLLVEDNPSDAYLVRALLKGTRFGRFDVTIVDRLAAAIAHARTHPVDAVLLDLSLPDSTGLPTITAFRQAVADLPVVVLTGLEDRSVGLQAIKEGCQDYLVKGSTGSAEGDGETIARSILYSIERKRLETELLRAKEEYQLLVEASPDAIVLCTTEQVLLVNEAARRLCTGRAEMAPSAFTGLVAARDRAAVRTLMGEVLDGARRSGVVEAQLEPCPASSESRGEDGGSRVLEAEVIVRAVSRSGAPAAEVIIHDLTARRDADHFRTLASSVFNGSAEAMIVTDAETRIQMVNAAFTEITGYLPEEVVGQKTHLLSSGRHPAAFYEAMWDTLLTTGHWHGDIWNRRRNGELYVQRLTISAIRSHDGTIETFLGVFSDVTERRREEDSVRQRAFHDVLTGLPNRALLEDRLDQAIAQARRRTGALAVLFLDLDGFKPINDRHGHQTGDELLRRVADMLKTCIRETDTVARIGGDEFIVLLTNIVDHAGVARIAQTILDGFAQPITIGEVVATVGGSIGIAVFSGSGDDPASLLANADKAMYEAKRQGKGRYCFYADAQGEAA